MNRRNFLKSISAGAGAMLATRSFAGSSYPLSGEQRSFDYLIFDNSYDESRSFSRAISPFCTNSYQYHEDVSALWFSGSRTSIASAKTIVAISRPGDFFIIEQLTRFGDMNVEHLSFHEYKPDGSMVHKFEQGYTSYHSHIPSTADWSRSIASSLVADRDRPTRSAPQVLTSLHERPKESPESFVILVMS